VTGWNFQTVSQTERDGSGANVGEYTAQYVAHFNLPLTFKGGCVGRAIGSAGGPADVHC
jgi:hypothetical protein